MVAWRSVPTLEPQSRSIDLPGAELSADLRLPANTRALVIFVHGSGSGRASPRNQYVADVLARRGLGSLLFDLLTGPEQRMDNLTGELRFDIPLLGRRLIHVILGAVNHPDGLFQQRGGQHTSQFFSLRISPIGQGRRNPGFEELMFPAVRPGRANVLDPHPISQAIADAAHQRKLPLCVPQGVEENPGAGLSGQVDGVQVRFGTLAFASNDAPVTDWATTMLRHMDYQACSASFIAVDGELAGLLVFLDTVRRETPQTLRRLRNRGIERIVMLTGDRLETAEMIALSAGIDELRAGLTPEDKVQAVQQGCQRASTLMVGDGVNALRALGPFWAQGKRKLAAEHIDHLQAEHQQLGALLSDLHRLASDRLSRRGLTWRSWSTTCRPHWRSMSAKMNRHCIHCWCET